MKEKAPDLFVGHGSPMNAIGENRSRPAWRKMGEELGAAYDNDERIVLNEYRELGSMSMTSYLFR